MKKIPMNGGGGSSCRKSTPGRRSGPRSTILIGDTITDAVRFQATGESSPSKESGCFGNPRTPVDPKIEVVTNRNTNPKIMKRMMNCDREIFIAPLYSLLKGKEKNRRTDSCRRVPYFASTAFRGRDPATSRHRSSTLFLPESDCQELCDAPSDRHPYREWHPRDLRHQTK